MTHTLYRFSRNIFLIAVVSAFFLFAQETHAADASDYAPSSDFASGAGLPTENQSPSDIVISGIRVVMQVLGIISLILIIYAGLTMLLSAGNSEKIGKAKSILVWTVIGGLIILSSLGILEFIDEALF